MNGGYKYELAVFREECVQLGDEVILVKTGGLDKNPQGVEEVRLIITLSQKHQDEDCAKIVIPQGSATPVQRFNRVIEREFIEEPISGKGVWIGVDPNEGSYIYIPETTYSVRTHKREGSLKYGSGWVQCWVNVGSSKLVLGEWCRPKFDKYGAEGIEILIPGDEVGAPMFWGLYHLLRGI